MALVNCSECNAQISDKAKACPKCGTPVIIKETFKCFECETQLEKGTTVCSNCGAEQKIKQEINIVPPVEYKTESSESNFVQPQKPKKKNKLLLWVLIGGGILVLIAIVVFYNWKHEGFWSEEQMAKRKADSVHFADSINAVKMQDSINSADITAMTQMKVDSAHIADSIAASNNYAGNQYTNSRSNTDNAVEQLRQEIIDKESQNPLDYLTVKYNLTSDIHLLRKSEDVVNGTIYNSASAATFKDVILKLKFFTNTDDLLSSNNYAVYDYIYPSGSKDFTIKVVSPAGTKKIGVEIVSAKAN